jgi:hypothetical protein
VEDDEVRCGTVTVVSCLQLDKRLDHQARAAALDDGLEGLFADRHGPLRLVPPGSERTFDLTTASLVRLRSSNMPQARLDVEAARPPRHERCLQGRPDVLPVNQRLHAVDVHGLALGIVGDLTPMLKHLAGAELRQLVDRRAGPARPLARDNSHLPLHALKTACCISTARGVGDRLQH